MQSILKGKKIKYNQILKGKKQSKLLFRDNLDIKIISYRCKSTHNDAPILTQIIMKWTEKSE